jgi:hypothetical protein
MSYFGAAPTGNFISTASQRVTGSTNNYVDLDHAISALSDVIVLVNSVKQDITNLTFTSASRITLGGTLVSSDVVEIVYLGKSVATQTPGTATVTNDMLAGSIANSKLANSSITLNGSAVSLGGSATISSALVSLGSASSTTNTANVTFDNVFSNTYTRYIIYIDYMYNGQTNTALRFNFRKSDGSGGYEDESRSGYVYAIAGRRHNNDEFDGVGSGSATTFGKLTPEITRSGGEHGLKAVLEVYRPGTVDSQATMTYVQARCMYRSIISDDAQSTHFNSSCNNYYGATSFLGIKLYFSGGDIDNYKIRLYGVVT